MSACVEYMSPHIDIHVDGDELSLLCMFVCAAMSVVLP